MGQENNTQYEINSVGLEGSKITEVQLCDSSKISTIDPQVKVGGSPKRKFSSHYKQQIISAYNDCNSSLERGALLRKEGLYSSHITKWRQLFLSDDNDTKKGSNKTLRNEHLVAEVEQLKKKLAQAQAIIDLQKKVSELLGTHILSHDSSEEN